MEQIQYQVTEQGQGFQAQKAPDYVAAFNAALEPERTQLQIYRDSVAARNQQEINAATRRIQEIEGLAQISESIQSNLVGLTEKINDAQYQRGLGYCLDNPNDPACGGTVEEDEQALKEGQVVANNTANEYEGAGGDQGRGSQIRNAGGWFGYGKFVGALTNKGQGFQGFLTQAKADGFSVEFNGKEITAENAESFEEYQIWQEGVRNEYLKDVPRASMGAASKYLLDPMRSTLNQDQTSWNSAYLERKKKEEKEDRGNLLGSALVAKDPTAVGTFLETHPGTARAARDELRATLIQQVTDGKITADQARAAMDQDILWNDGSTTTLSKQFPQEFYAFDRELERAESEDYKFQRLQESNDARELENLIESQGRPLTDLEIDEIARSPKYVNNGAAQEFLRSYKTKEDLDDDSANAYLSALYDRGELTPEVLEKYPQRIKDKWAEKAQSDGTYGNDYAANSKIVKDDVEAAAREAVGYDQGVVSTKDPKFLMAQRNGMRMYKEYYMRGRRNGLNDAEAMEFARQQLEKNRLSMLTKPEPITLETKALDANKFIRDNPGTLGTIVLPDTTSELQQAHTYLTTGKGSMPGLYTTIAEGQPFTARDLAIMQVQAAGMDLKGIKVPEKEKPVQALSPQLQALINYKPAGSRTYVAAEYSGDKRWLLDGIASVESGAAGYDAVNQIGTNGGHGVLGYSGAYSKMPTSTTPGRKVTDLTVGEVMALQDNSGKNRQLTDAQWIGAGRLHAVGRYQFTGGTLAGLVKRLKIDPNTKFSPALQDMLALHKIRERVQQGNLYSGLRSEWIGLQNVDEEKYARMVQAAKAVESPFNRPENLTPGVE